MCALLNACNHHWGSSTVDMGILSKNINSPSHECQMTFCSVTNDNDAYHLSDFSPYHDLNTELDLLPNYERFPRSICNGYRIQTGNAHSFVHVVPSHFGLACLLLSLVGINHFLKLVIFPTKHFEHSRVLSWFCSFFLFYLQKKWLTFRTTACFFISFQIVTYVTKRLATVKNKLCNSLNWMVNVSNVVQRPNRIIVNCDIWYNWIDSLWFVRKS